MPTERDNPQKMNPSQTGGQSPGQPRPSDPQRGNQGGSPGRPTQPGRQGASQVDTKPHGTTPGREEDDEKMDRDE
jgi:hypothetical protein